MNDLQEALYTYILEKQYTALQEDAEYQRAHLEQRAAMDALEKVLTVGQWRVYDRYLETSSAVGALEQRNIFKKTLRLGVELFSLR